MFQINENPDLVLLSKISSSTKVTVILKSYTLFAKQENIVNLNILSALKINQITTETLCLRNSKSLHQTLNPINTNKKYKKTTTNKPVPASQTKLQTS